MRREISSGDSSIVSEHPPDQQLYQLDHLQSVVVHEENVDYENNVSSDDSFHSTTEYIGDRPLVRMVCIRILSGHSESLYV